MSSNLKIFEFAWWNWSNGQNFTKHLEFWRVWNKFWMIWIRDWIFFLTRIIKNFWTKLMFYFFVKLQIPATKTTCDWDFPGKFGVSNSSSCVNRSIEAHGMHIRDTCQWMCKKSDINWIKAVCEKKVLSWKSGRLSKKDIGICQSMDF